VNEQVIAERNTKHEPKD